MGVLRQIVFYPSALSDGFAIRCRVSDYPSDAAILRAATSPTVYFPQNRESRMSGNWIHRMLNRSPHVPETNRLQELDFRSHQDTVPNRRHNQSTLRLCRKKVCYTA